MGNHIHHGCHAGRGTDPGGDVMRPAIVVDTRPDPIEYKPELYITLEVTDADYYPLPEDKENEAS